MTNGKSLLVIYCKEKLLQWGLRAELICECVGTRKWAGEGGGREDSPLNLIRAPVSIKATDPTQQGAAFDQGPRATPCSPGVMGERAYGREVPTQARVCAAGRDEQRLSTILELYYRKAGRKERRRESESEREGGMAKR